MYIYKFKYIYKYMSIYIYIHTCSYDYIDYTDLVGEIWLPSSMVSFFSLLASTNDTHPFSLATAKLGRNAWFMED